MGYWEERLAKSQNKRTEKSIKETEEQLRKYYSSAMKKIIGQFEETYNKLLLSIEEGKEPTPADLYKLDKYWQMQGQLRQELEKLGDKQVGALSDSFMRHYQGVYESLSLPSGKDYGTIDKKGAYQMINQIWCADGKSWSDRVWTNTDRLQETLNQHLIDCVVTGKKPTELKKILQEDFQVSYSRADSVVRTEMAHIQTQAAQQRYIDYGITEVEVLVGEDERTCKICSKLEGKKFSVKASMPVPAHPRCRCCIIPTFDAITQAYPNENLNRSELIGVPASTTNGDNQEIRLWYYVNIHDIATRIDYSLPIAEQAQQACNLRNEIKLEARAAMKDRAKAEELNRKEPPATLEELILSKMARYKMTREEALRDVVRSAPITRKSVDEELFGE